MEKCHLADQQNKDIQGLVNVGTFRWEHEEEKDKITKKKCADIEEGVANMLTPAKGMERGGTKDFVCAKCEKS